MVLADILGNVDWHHTVGIRRVVDCRRRKGRVEVAG